MTLALNASCIESGAREPAVGIAGQHAEVYYHNLAIEVLGDPRLLPTAVGFSREVVLPLLGRSFFRHFQAVIFSELTEEVELKLSQLAAYSLGGDGEKR